MTAANKPKVRVRRFKVKRDTGVIVFPGTGTISGLVITNLPKGVSAKKVKRLLEIAAMDEAKLVDDLSRICWDTQKKALGYMFGWEDVSNETRDRARSCLRAALKSIGLSSQASRLTPPARRKDGKK